MKSSTLIKRLQDLVNRYGDLDVAYPDNCEGGYTQIDYINVEYPYKAGQFGVEDKDADPIFFSLK